MRATKNDANKKEIVLALNSMGIHWHDTPTTKTREPKVDGIAYNPSTMVFRFVEIKGKRGTLTPLQTIFMSLHPGQCVVLRTVKDCERLRAMI